MTTRESGARKESSMHVCARLVAQGQADGFLSAGNTGACMAIAKMVFGKVSGVDRPALSGVFPSHKGTPWWCWMSARTWIMSPRCCSSSIVGRDLLRVGFEDHAAAGGVAVDWGRGT